MIKDTTNKIVKKLKEQEKEEGSLPLLLEFYKKLAEVQAAAQKKIGAIEPTISTVAIDQRMSQGQPLVRFEELAIDWELIRETFTKVISIFAQYPQLFADIPERLTAPKAGRLLTKKATRAWFEGKALPVTLAEGIGENLIQAIIQATLQPFLNKHALALIDKVKGDKWRRNYCPICGGSPDFAFFETEIGGRNLVCSRCDSEWAYQRLECPYCSNKDQSLITFSEDEKGIYRLHQCKNCQCYLKTIDLRKASGEILFPLERIYTLHLDIQAQEMGFHPYNQRQVQEDN